MTVGDAAAVREALDRNPLTIREDGGRSERHAAARAALDRLVAEVEQLQQEATAELDAARAEAGKLRQAWRANVDDLTAQYGEVVKRLEAEAGKLRAALLDYGVHKIRCAVTADIGAGGDGEVPCTCGFTALTALAGSDAPPTPSEAEAQVVSQLKIVTPISSPVSSSSRTT